MGIIRRFLIVFLVTQLNKCSKFDFFFQSKYACPFQVRAMAMFQREEVLQEGVPRDGVHVFLDHVRFHVLGGQGLRAGKAVELQVCQPRKVR